MTHPSGATVMLELARRCEQAAGPDRELDNAIADAVGFRRSALFHNFTASRDAAVTLVPEGLSVALYIHSDETHCDVYRLHPGKLLGEAAQAKTPALALTAAALKARAAGEGR